jgi:sugar transferase (PEP-CTERM system associated)
MLKIFNKYYSIRGFIFFLGETVLIFAGIWLSMLLQAGEQAFPYPYSPPVLFKILLITFLIQVCLYYNNLYEFTYSRSLFDLIIRIIQSIGFAVLSLAAIYFLQPSFAVEQGIFFVGLFFLLVLLVSWRIAYQYFCRSGIFKERILLVGDGKLASLISREVQGNLDSGYSIAGIFSNPGSSSLAQDLGVKKFTDYKHICTTALAEGVDKIVVALEEKRGKFPLQPLLDCRMKGLRIFDGVSFYETLSGKILATSVPPSWLIFADGFRRHKLILASKRISDVVFSLAGLICALPLMAVIALAVKATSPGPVFFRQTRIGQHERKFRVVKFRTMREDAEAGTGAVWAVDRDPRITRVGGILRKLRLDELPQFWNVLKGEMSFVGPRPERPEFVQQLKEQLPYYGERHTVKPGITGWAQINYGYGASIEDALRKLEYDLFYVKNLSLLFDAFIVLKTFKAVLIGKDVR